MDDAFWHNRWSENKIGFHQQIFNPHLTTFWEKLHFNPQGSIFVPLCGKSRDLLWLNQQGYAVIGVELSEIAVKAFFDDNNLQYKQQQKGAFRVYTSGTIQLLCGDFFDLTAADLRTVQGVYDRASLIALPHDLRKRYVTHFVSLFGNEIRQLLVTLEYPQSEMQGPPFSVDESEVLAIYSNAYKVEKVLEVNILNLEENARFKAQGLTSLVEKVFLLMPFYKE